jgi:hypothetical protein
MVVDYCIVGNRENILFHFHWQKYEFKNCISPTGNLSLISSSKLVLVESCSVAVIETNFNDKVLCLDTNTL